jgi:hypothetical protein
MRSTIAALHEDAVRAAYAAVSAGEQPNFKEIVLGIARLPKLSATRVANDLDEIVPVFERAEWIASVLGRTRAHMRKANDLEDVLRLYEVERRAAAIELAADRVSHVGRDDIERVVGAVFEVMASRCCPMAMLRSVGHEPVAGT